MLPDIAFGDDQNVLGEAHTQQGAIQGVGGLPSMDSVGHHHEDVQVAVLRELPSCPRSEQNDASVFRQRESGTTLRS